MTVTFYAARHTVGEDGRIYLSPHPATPDLNVANANAVAIIRDMLGLCDTCQDDLYGEMEPSEMFDALDAFREMRRFEPDLMVKEPVVHEHFDMGGVSIILEGGRDHERVSRYAHELARIARFAADNECKVSWM